MSSVSLSVVLIHFRGGTPKIIFHIPEEPLSMKTKTIYVKRRLLAHGDYSSISNYRTRILATFSGIFIIFFFLLNFKLFIPLLLSEPLKVFCGTLMFRGTQFEKHRYRSYAFSECCWNLREHWRRILMNF
jgi:hypothetical protein